MPECKLMGQFINKVKVKCDYDNMQDKNFIFTVLAENKQDLIETVNQGLRQKIEEGEMQSQNLRSIEIKSDDERGFFASVAGDVGSLIKLL